MNKPNRFDEKRRARYLGALRQGMRRGAAARRAGIDRTQVWAYAKAHPEFADQCAQAEIDACDYVEDALWQKAVTERNVTAQIFWLQNRSPDRWKDRRNPIQINQAAPPTKQNLEEEIEKVLKGTTAESSEEEARTGVPIPQDDQ